MRTQPIFHKGKPTRPRSTVEGRETRAERFERTSTVRSRSGEAEELHGRGEAGGAVKRCKSDPGRYCKNLGPTPSGLQAMKRGKFKMKNAKLLVAGSLLASFTVE